MSLPVPTERATDSVARCKRLPAGQSYSRKYFSAAHEDRAPCLPDERGAEVVCAGSDTRFALFAIDGDRNHLRVVTLLACPRAPAEREHERSKTQRGPRP